MFTGGLHRIGKDVLTNLAGNGLHEVCGEVHCQELGAEMYLTTAGELLHDFPSVSDPCLSSPLALTGLFGSVKHSFEFFADLHI